MHFLYFEVTGPLCSPASRSQMLTSACSALSISALLLQGFLMSLPDVRFGVRGDGRAQQHYRND